ncbi:MAG TPA: TrbI/VirB10 family protein [Caulobacterales bacterium]|nr:TrbI/VirB10 family protein [Caulobacterales bacterium]
MSDPARPEMAQGRLRELPQSYDDTAVFARQSGTQEVIPQLGDPMAGDIAAFAPEENYASYDPAVYGSRAREPAGASGSYAPSGAAAQPSEMDMAQRSGLFFQLRERSERGAGAGDIQAAAQEESAEDRAAMTSQHRLMAPASRYSLHPGTIIPASLVTAINSEAPGPVIAQVTQGVYDSTTGDRLLMPQGARLIGSYRSATRYGQRRIAITWSRLVMPDGRQIVLDEAAVDPAGASGVAGDIDNHWGEVFGAAALGTLINVATATTQDRQSLGVTYAGIGVVSGDDPAEEAAREGVQRTASAVSGRVVERGLSVPPTMRVNSGARISAMVTREVVIQTQ